MVWAFALYVCSCFFLFITLVYVLCACCRKKSPERNGEDSVQDQDDDDEEEDNDDAEPVKAPITSRPGNRHSGNGGHESVLILVCLSNVWIYLAIYVLLSGHLPTCHVLKHLQCWAICANILTKIFDTCFACMLQGLPPVYTTFSDFDLWLGFDKVSIKQNPLGLVSHANFSYSEWNFMWCCISANWIAWVRVCESRELSCYTDCVQNDGM